MLSNRLAVAALGIACIGAAAAGGYLALRQTVVPAPAAAQVQGTNAPAAVPNGPVRETEALVGDAASRAPAAGTAAKTATTGAARRVEPPARATTAGDARSTAARQEQAPAPTILTSTWPASAAAQPPAVPATPPATTTDTAVPAPRADDRADRAAQEPARAPEPPQKTFEELVVSADSVIGLQTENRISSETARVEDRVEARVTRDVKVGDRVAIPAGARAVGTVMQVERGGKFKERARLGIRFTMLVLADGTRVPISTDTIFRDGEAPGNTSAAKVGGAAVGGAILGALLGGAKGAVMGGAAGAAGGSAAVMAGDRSPATLPAGTPMTVRILAPVTITTEKN